jgi:hypothetical protein
MGICGFWNERSVLKNVPQLYTLRKPVDLKLPDFTMTLMATLL